MRENMESASPNKQHPEIKTISGCLCVWRDPTLPWRLSSLPLGLSTIAALAVCCGCHVRGRVVVGLRVIAWGDLRKPFRFDAVVVVRLSLNVSLNTPEFSY